MRAPRTGAPCGAACYCWPWRRGSSPCPHRRCLAISPTLAHLAAPVSIALGALGMWLLFCPPQTRQLATVQERRQAQKIVETYGCSSNARLALLDDKVFHFTPGGSVIGYTVRGRTAVALGDPVGPAEDAPEAIEDFKRLCDRQGWLPAFCLTTPRYLEQYRLSGFEAFRLGHEGILELESFALNGRSSKSFRKRFNRALGGGYRVEIYQPPISDVVMAQVRSVSDEWLTMTRRQRERLFPGLVR